ncbi:unnamed protein product, partial [Medioppia subpectinata]
RDTENKHITRHQVYHKTYDFIVIGSGSAGGPVAYRLAATPGVRVLLLEAGPVNSVVSDIPIEYVTLFQSEYDWNYAEERQPVGLAFKDGRIPENRGRVLGGSSSINAMIYNRGHRQTFDDWSREFGAQGWRVMAVILLMIIAYVFRSQIKKWYFENCVQKSGQKTGPKTVGQQKSVQTGRTRVRVPGDLSVEEDSISDRELSIKANRASTEEFIPGANKDRKSTIPDPVGNGGGGHTTED